MEYDKSASFLLKKNDFWATFTSVTKRAGLRLMHFKAPEILRINAKLIQAEVVIRHTAVFLIGAGYIVKSIYDVRNNK